MQASSFKIAVVGSSGSQAGGFAADAEEAQIQKGLPVIEGLTAGMSEASRMAVYDKTIAMQRAAFISQYGDAFGCERRAEPRGKVFGETVMVAANGAFAIDTI